MGISKGETEREEEYFERVQETGYYSLLYLAQTLAGRDDTQPTEIWVVTDDLHEIESKDSPCPEKATLLGAMKVIPQEYEHITCKCIDVGRAGGGREEGLASRIVAEVRAKSSDTVIAFRGSNRWAQRFEAVDIRADESLIPFQQNGVYLITGGLGSIGLHLAEYLAGVAQARLILIQRSTLPEKQGWQDWLDTHDEHDAIARKIRKVRTLEDLGAEVMVISADVARESQMRLAVGKAVDRFGRINGVIHCAGMAGQHALKLICEANRSQAEAHFQSKVYGLYSLERVLREQPADWCLLFSSNAAVLGGLGSIGYTAANLFMDSFVSRRGLACNTRWISCNWDGWLVDEASKLSPTFQTSLDQYAMQSGEGLEAFRRVISSGVAGQVIISTGSLEQRLSIWINRPGSGGERGAGEGSLPGPFHERPDLSTLYVPPTDELEEKIVSIWQELLGIQQLGVHDNFFDLGGDSLISLKVTSRLKKELGVDIPVVAIFEGPTVSALAKLIGPSRNQEPDYDESRARGERRKQRRRQKGGALPTL
jgi:NAD(P)-dependent dehydrogenase (short-subunit alcohol dehydrogenase family)/acyl carrier protein